MAVHAVIPRRGRDTAEVCISSMLSQLTCGPTHPQSSSRLSGYVWIDPHVGFLSLDYELPFDEDDSKQRIRHRDRPNPGRMRDLCGSRALSSVSSVRM